MSQPSPLAAAQHHAQALAATGDLAGAQLTLQYALESGRAELGEDDPAVLATAHQLATVHRQAGEKSAARRVLEEAFAAGQWRLGDADPLMLSISFDLGVVAEELGNRHEARRAFGRVAGVGPEVLGDDHWAVQQARDYLGDEPPTVRLELPDTPPRLAPADGPGGPGGYERRDGPDADQVGYPGQATPDRPAVPSPRIAPESSPPRPMSAQPTSAQPTSAQPTSAQPMSAQPVSAGEVAPQSGTPVTAEPYLAAQDVNGGYAPGVFEAGRYGAGPGVTATGAAGWDQVAVPSPAYFPERPAEPRGRGPAVFAAVAAGVAAMIAVAALVLVLVTRDDGAGGGVDERPNTPVLGGGRPPSDVRLRDVGSTVELTWTDPTAGTVSFLVTGGHPGEVLKPMAQISPGQTSLKLHGLNAGLDYCFAVVAVYSLSEFNTSPQTCTNRARSSPQPSRTT